MVGRVLEVPDKRLSFTFHTMHRCVVGDWNEGIEVQRYSYAVLALVVLILWWDHQHRI